MLVLLGLVLVLILFVLLVNVEEECTIQLVNIESRSNTRPPEEGVRQIQRHESDRKLALPMNHSFPALKMMADSWGLEPKARL